jgi:hypothetical protein
LRALFRTVAVCLLAALALALLPEPAAAFGPATHIYLGRHLLDGLFLVPERVAALLHAYPQSFLYGSVAADISFAKKYVPAGRHCHFWHVGEEILHAAGNDRLRAVAYGYLSHLAADTIALLRAPPVAVDQQHAGLGPAWEHRLDTQLGEPRDPWPGAGARVRPLEADNLFDSVSGTIFSFETNRRIFRGMISPGNERWRSIFDRVLQKSRWDLNAETIDSYTSLAFDFVVDYLLRGRDSVAAGLDPVGDFHLGLAKKVRRMALREGKLNRPETLREMADDFFPLPRPRLDYWQQRVSARNGDDGYY